MERKAIFVSSETHHELKILSVAEMKTFDAMIKKLVNFYQVNN